MSYCSEWHVYDNNMNILNPKLSYEFELKNNIMNIYQTEAKRIYDEFYIICQEYTEEIQCSIQAKKCALRHVELWKSRHEFALTYYDKIKQEIEKL